MDFNISLVNFNVSCVNFNEANVNFNEGEKMDDFYKRMEIVYKELEGRISTIDEISKEDELYNDLFLALNRMKSATFEVLRAQYRIDNSIKNIAIKNDGFDFEKTEKKGGRI